MTAQVLDIQETHITRYFDVRMTVTIGEMSHDVSCHVALDYDCNAGDGWSTVERVKPESFQSVVEELDSLITKEVKRKAYDEPED